MVNSKSLTFHAVPILDDLSTMLVILWYFCLYLLYLLSEIYFTHTHTHTRARARAMIKTYKNYYYKEKSLMYHCTIRIASHIIIMHPGMISEIIL